VHASPALNSAVTGKRNGLCGMNGFLCDHKWD
jgi:hypothetical protein